MSAETKRRYTLDEYLALERASDARLEFWDGEIFAMSGGTLSHEQVMGNMFDLLRNQLRDGKSTVFGSNMHIK
ncbi:MAG TPA: Uma2 family endonuclease, partial [Blastocatellia bacterium]|nr:Uma2 family endonuclease [Blastocatellia bacterium]